MKRIHALLDIIPFINNNPYKLSIQTRTLNTLLNLQNIIYGIFRINRIKWKGPYYDRVWIAFFNMILNYAISTAVPTPLTTNIRKQILNKNAIQSYIKNLNLYQQRYEDKMEPYDYNQFYPQNVNLLWISGNDDIEYDENSNNRLIIYVHGGGYSLCGPSHIGYCSQLSLKTNTKILFIEYSKPPKADIPHQVDEILTAYFYVLFQLKISNKKIIIAGDSAGAGLCSLILQKLSFLGLTDYHPIGTLLYSPFIDLTLSGDSWAKFAKYDMIVSEGFASRSGLIATGNNAQLLRSPFFSALYAPNIDIKSNVMIFVSTTECLYDDSKRLLNKLNPINNEYRIIYNEAHHVPHAFVVLLGVIPEADHAMNQITKNIKKWFKNGYQTNR